MLYQSKTVYVDLSIKCACRILKESAFISEIFIPKCFKVRMPNCLIGIKVCAKMEEDVAFVSPVDKFLRPLSLFV